MEPTDKNLISLPNFNFNNYRIAETESEKNEIFEEEIKLLSEIVFQRKENIEIPKSYFGLVLKEICFAPLNNDQMERIYTLFIDNGLRVDYNDIVALKLILTGNHKKVGDLEDQMHRAVTVIRTYNIWEEVHPNIENHSEYKKIVKKYNRCKSFEEMIDGLEPWNTAEGAKKAIEALKGWFTFKDLREAKNENKEARFEKIISQLEEILSSKSLPDGYYEKVKRKLIKAELNASQEEKICQIFEDKKLNAEAAEISVSHDIYQFNPSGKNAEEVLKHVILNIQQYHIWERIGPQLKKLSPEHHQVISDKYLTACFEAKVASLESLNDVEEVKEQLKAWLVIKDKNEAFEQKLAKLKQILEFIKKKNNLPDGFYEVLLEDIIQAGLTENEAEKVCRAFASFGREEDGNVLLAASALQHYDPSVKREDKAFRKTMLWINQNKIWDRLYPKLEALSPNFHVEINQEHLDSLKTLKTLFDEMLTKFEPWDSQKVILLLENFQKKYKKIEGYSKLEWTVIYQLIRSKLSILSSDEKSKITSVYFNALDDRSQTSFGKIINYLLAYVDRTVYADFNLKYCFENHKINLLKPFEIQHIGELCAAVSLSSEEEKETFDLLPKEGKEFFLIERFRVYSENIKCTNYKDSKYWTLARLTTFFDLICSKFYYKFIEGKTFSSVVELIVNQLNKEEIEAIKTVPYFKSYVDVEFDCYFVKSGCSKIKRIKDEKEIDFLSKTIIENLKVLAELYAQPSYYKDRYLTVDMWDDVFDHIKSLNLPRDLYTSILQVFRRRKDPNTWTGSFLSGTRNYVFGATKPNVKSEWKGEIHDIQIKSNHNWVIANKDWILEKLKCTNNSDITKVEKLVKLFNDFNIVESKSLTIENVLKYNIELQKKEVDWRTKLRDALTTKEFTNAFDRYSSFGREKASGATEILKELCNFNFTGMNGFPLLLKLKKNLIALGFEKLAEDKKEVAYKAERELLRFNNPLDLPFDLQQDAIEGLPLEIKTLYFQLLGVQSNDAHLNGNLPYSFLSLDYLNEERKAKKVNFLQIATPLNPQGINPEFSVFLKNEGKDIDQVSLFISLQSGTDEAESKWNKEQMNSQRRNTHFITIPAKGDFYMQEGEYDKPATSEDFASSIGAKFIAFNKKGQPEVNQPGNYLLRESLITNNNEFNVGLSACREDIKKIFYPNKSILSSTERRILLKLHNIRMMFYLISYTSATTFGLLGEHAGVYNSLIVKLLNILFDNKDEVAFQEGEVGFTFDEMRKGLVNGPVRKAKNADLDELKEALTLLDDPTVQNNLLLHKKVFRIESMSYPNFDIKPNEV